jgi:hypothetical protein
MKQFSLMATWDPNANVWWGTNGDLPVTTEAATLDELEQRAQQIGQEMAEINGLVSPGESIEIRVIKE